MKLPSSQPGARRSGLSASDGGLAPQSCNTFKKIACGAAVAGCIATPNPVACIMAVAPSCADCL